MAPIAYDFLTEDEYPRLKSGNSVNLWSPKSKSFTSSLFDKVFKL